MKTPCKSINLLFGLIVVSHEFVRRFFSSREGAGASAFEAREGS